MIMYVSCNIDLLAMKWNKNGVVGYGALAWDYDAWDNMWNVVGKGASCETLGDGVVSVYLDIGDV